MQRVGIKKKIIYTFFAKESIQTQKNQSQEYLVETKFEKEAENFSKILENINGLTQYSTNIMFWERKYFKRTSLHKMLT